MCPNSISMPFQRHIVMKIQQQKTGPIAHLNHIYSNGLQYLFLCEKHLSSWYAMHASTMMVLPCGPAHTTLAGMSGMSGPRGTSSGSWRLLSGKTSLVNLNPTVLFLGCWKPPSGWYNRGAGERFKVGHHRRDGQPPQLGQNQGIGVRLV